MRKDIPLSCRPSVITSYSIHYTKLYEAANLPPEESEVELAKLTTVPSDKIKIPGIAEAKIRMECVLERAIELGGTPSSPTCDLIIGRVICFHIEDNLS